MSALLPRQAAVEALMQVHRDGGYSNIVLDTLLKTHTFSSPDRALVSRLFYGVIERRLTLDYVIGRLSQQPLRRMSPKVAEILRVGIYQLLYMDKIPSSAAVNESVKLTKAMGAAYASGFVNALLRNVLRQRETLFAGLPNDADGDAIRYSVPKHWIAAWTAQYGEKITRELLTAIGTPPPQVVRINTLRISCADFCARLAAAGVSYASLPDLPEGIYIPAGFDWKRLAKIEENCYYYQDGASQYCCAALDPQPGERIADVCAAPGGKSFTIAGLMDNQGELLSCDVYPQKCAVLEKRAAELGITCLKTTVRDATQPIPAAWRAAFDRVLCDVPCSGLGVIRRKPEIRYRTLDQVSGLPAIQTAILHAAADMVRPGGILQYSTCTLRPEENEAVAAAFLETHPQFSPRVLPLKTCFEQAGLPPSHCITLLPNIQGTDGFFIASFIKNT